MWVNTLVSIENLADGMEIAEDVKDASGRLLVKAPRKLDGSLKKMLLGRGILSVLTRTWQEKDPEVLLTELRGELAQICFRHERLKSGPLRDDSIRLFREVLEKVRGVSLPAGEETCHGG